MLEKIGELLTNGFVGLIMGIFKGILAIFDYGYMNLLENLTKMIENAAVQSAISYSIALALALLTIKVIYETFQTYILYQSGDPDADPMGILLRSAVAIGVILTMDELLAEMIKFGSYVVKDVQGIQVLNTNVKFLDVYLNTSFVGNTQLVIVLLLLFIAIALLIVAIQTSIRGAELALLGIIGPVIALNLTSTNRDLFNMWIKQIIVVCASQAIQFLMIRVGIGLGSRIGTTVGLKMYSEMFITMGWLWVTISAPKFLKQFTYTSGVGGLISGASRSAGSSYMMNLMRKK